MIKKLTAIAAAWLGLGAMKAKVVIQHEPADIAKLPPFPKSAR